MLVLRMILHLLTSDETKFDIIHELSCIQRGIENIAGRDKKEGKGMKINIYSMTFNQPKAMLVINTHRF